MSTLKCPGFKGSGWFGLWGKCRFVLCHGFGWISDEGSIEYLCQHPKTIEAWDSLPNVDCPTKGERP